ncbi:U3 small nucleolar ribonucleoprotein lcp5-like protein [Xylariaceae sp. FL0255]|nr:U3 small nucleolar ribonucleoprotein lcp5-like protein [Xylariaceae sp. FL0255]
MVAPITLPALLESLTGSLTSAFEVTPKLESITDTENGVSLLDVKNELLLSYLQNLVFLILIKIRNAKSSASSEEDEAPKELPADVVKKLVELRLYLDKGVRPLEERLRFQLDKIVRAADDAERDEERAVAKGKQDDDDDSDSETGSGSEEDSDGEDGDRAEAKKSDAKHGPAFGNFAAPVSTGMAAAAQDKTGVYRPPKITPTVMPTTENRRERAERRPAKSAAMSEYINEELSIAPSAQPSVGSNVVFGGRKVKTAAEREVEDRRREYEETNFVRLPKESKQQRAEKNKSERRSAKMSFGGEEWREIGEGADRIHKLTRQGKDGGSKRGTKALLELSRKRGRETTDGNRGSGFSSGTREIGERFNKKVKVMEGGRRDRGKR